MAIRLRNSFTALVVGIIGVLIFVCAVRVEQYRFPVSVVDDLSGAVFEGGDRYDANRFRAMVYEPSLEVEIPGTRVRMIDVDFSILGSEEKEYPQTLRIYAGDGNYSLYASDAAHIRPGTVRFAFDGSVGSVTKLRMDFTGMHGKLIDIGRIVINPNRFVNLPFLAAAAAVFIPAVMVLSVLLTQAGAVLFAAGFMLVMCTGGAALLASPTMRIQPMFFFFSLFAAVSLFLFLFPGRKGKYPVFMAALLIVVFFTALWWASAAPFGEGPDEVMHYDVVRYIFENGALPRGDDPAVIDPRWGFSYAFSPILPFMLGAWAGKVLAFFGISDDLLFAARLVSVLSGTLAVLFTASAARRIFPESPMKYVMPALVGLFPQILFVSTYVNCDAFGLMTTAMIVCAWTAGIEKRWRYRDCFFLAAGIGLCALSYYNCYGFILVSVLLFLATSGFRRGRAKKTAAKIVFIALIVSAVCGWWFVRNAVLYDGDFLGRETMRKTAELYAEDGYRPSQIVTPKSSGMTVSSMFRETEFVKETLTSFVGRFSNFSLQVKMPVVRLWLIMIAVGLAGSLRLLLSIPREKRRIRAAEAGGEQAVSRFSAFRMSAAAQIAMLAAMAVPPVLSVIYSYAGDFQPQGRYILPAAVPLFYFVCQGLDETGNLLYKAFKRKKAQGSAVPEEIAGTAAIACAFSAAVSAVMLTVYRYYV